MPTSPGNPLALTQNQFDAQPQLGDVVKQRELTAAAPISGAPIPGSGTTSAPATQGAAPPVPPGPMATPFAPTPAPPDYVQQLAATWHGLASLPGASPVVKALAKEAAKRARGG